MKTYRLTVQVENEHAMLLAVRKMMKAPIVVTSIELVVSTDADALPVIIPHGNAQPELGDRNSEIIEKYEADPKANSSCKLADEYGISRERVCQILRPVNVIAKHQERRIAARQAMVEETEAIKAAANAEVQSNIEKGLELIKAGKSARQAAVDLGYQAHSKFTTALNNAASAVGLPRWHGRWRDMSARRNRVTELMGQGLHLSKVITVMRGEGEKINLEWIYRNMRDEINAARQNKDKSCA